MVSIAREGAERLRALLILKEQIAGPRFADLVDALPNDMLRSALLEIAEAAPGHRETLLSIATAWASASTPIERTGTGFADGSARHAVETWARLLESSSKAALEIADAAPRPELRAQLEMVANEDAAHAKLLRALL